MPLRGGDRRRAKISANAQLNLSPPFGGFGRQQRAAAHRLTSMASRFSPRLGLETPLWAVNPALKTLGYSRSPLPGLLKARAVPGSSSLTE